jgi:hypothetical protein
MYKRFSGFVNCFINYISTLSYYVDCITGRVNIDKDIDNPLSHLSLQQYTQHFFILLFLIPLLPSLPTGRLYPPLATEH